MDFSNALTTGETFHSQILRMKGYALDDGVGVPCEVLPLDRVPIYSNLTDMG
jgi:hypothetical protein